MYVYLSPYSFYLIADYFRTDCCLYKAELICADQSGGATYQNVAKIGMYEME